MPNGTLRVAVSLAGQAAPLAGVTATVRDESGAVVARLLTDANGESRDLALPAPDRAYSLDADNTAVRPYAVYDLTAEKAGWRTQSIHGIQVFDGQTTLARLELLPAADGGTALARLAEAPIVIPPHPLFAGDAAAGGSARGPRSVCPPNAGRVLTQVVVPRRITVHLGAPNASAANVTVDFQTYIATVASCEVYPTWVGVTKYTRLWNALKIPVDVYTATFLCWIGRIDNNRVNKEEDQFTGQGLNGGN